MRHIPWILTTVLLGAAGPVDLPVPPIPPPLGAGDQAAPIPDESVAAPAVIASGDPSFALRNYGAQRFNPSQGFTPGSHYRSSEERKAIQTPGFSVTVPLQ